jgi:hypothetical protein
MFVRYIIAMTLAALAILFAIILGDYGPWYLSWFLGTGFMVLVAVSAGVLFEAQEDAARAQRGAGETLDISSAVEAPSPKRRPSR